MNARRSELRSGEPSGRRSAAWLLLASNYGLLIWALCFVALYVLLSLGCRLPLAHQSWLSLPALSLALTGLWLVHAAWLFWLIGKASQRYKALAGAGDDRRFLARLALLLHAAALLATIWTGFPVVLLPVC